MANQERGELRLVTPGGEYTLRLTTNACCELEDRSGQSFEAHLDRWNATHAVTAFRWMLWALLQDRHKTIAPTPEAVGPLMDACEKAALIGIMAAFIRLNVDLIQELMREGLLVPPKAGSESAAHPLRAQPVAAGVDSTSALVGSV